jgi:hypothetical protein
MMMATFTITTAHAFVLTVSHDLLFRQPRFCGGTDAAASFTEFHSHSAALSAAPSAKQSCRGWATASHLSRQARGCPLSGRDEPMNLLGLNFHDLNLAIRMPSNPAFAIQLSRFLSACAADLLEPNS